MLERVRGRIAASLGIAALVLTSLGLADPAVAAAPPPSGDTITAAQMLTAVRSLEASSVPRSQVTLDGTVFYRFFAPNGAGITLPSAASLTPSATTISTASANGEAHPNLTVKTYGGYMAVAFNRADQAALTGGGGAALGLLLCAISGPVCVVATIVLAAAGGYLSSKGLCPSNQQLWWYDVLDSKGHSKGGSTVQCRSTVPPPFK